MFCNNCGYALRDDEAVCPNCGNVLSVSSEGTRIKSTFGGTKSHVDTTSSYGYSSSTGSSYSSDLTPPGTYNPSPIDSGSYSGGGYSGSGYTSGDSLSSGYGRTTSPDYSTPSYSSSRAYVPAGTDKYMFARIIVAAILMIAVCIVPIFKGDSETCLEFLEPAFESLGEVIEGADVFFEHASTSLIVIVLGLDVGVILSFFAAIGVLIGVLLKNKKMAGSMAVVGIFGMIFIFAAMFTAATESNASVFEGLEFGFWVIAGLYITSCTLAIEK